MPAQPRGLCVSGQRGAARASATAQENRGRRKPRLAAHGGGQMRASGTPRHIINQGGRQRPSTNERPPNRHSLPLAHVRGQLCGARTHQHTPWARGCATRRHCCRRGCAVQLQCRLIAGTVSEQPTWPAANARGPCRRGALPHTAAQGCHSKGPARPVTDAASSPNQTHKHTPCAAHHGRTHARTSRQHTRASRTQS